MVDGGNACINRSSFFATSRATMLIDSPITIAGTITSWCIYCLNSGTIALRVYRENGSNYDYVGGSSGESTPSGISNHSTNIDVQVGDIIGFYMISQGNIDADYTGSIGVNTYDNDGDSTSTTAQSNWTHYSDHLLSLSVTITTPKPMKINIGDSWKGVTTMKINIGDSWKDVVGIQQNIGDTWKTVF